MMFHVLVPGRTRPSQCSDSRVLGFELSSLTHWFFPIVAQAEKW